MAERDGTIVIDTQIDTKGVDAGSEKTELLLKDVDMIKYALLLLFRLEKRIIKHICEKH